MKAELDPTIIPTSDLSPTALVEYGEMDSTYITHIDGVQVVVIPD